VHRRRTSGAIPCAARPAYSARTPAVQSTTTPKPAKPPRRTLRECLADALISLHGEGVDIQVPASVDDLRFLSMEKAEIKNASKPTFERALKDARNAINSIKPHHDGDDGT
jgi:hypothetical protein